MNKPIEFNNETFECTIVQSAYEAREAALESSALIVRVEDESAQKTAVAAQKNINALLRSTEATRTELKRIPWEIAKAIDAKAKVYTEPLLEEKTRLARIVGDYQAVLRRRAEAEEAKQKAALQALERERQEKLAKANTIEEIDEVNSAADEKARQEAPPPPAPPRVKGQFVRDDWDFEFTDLYALAREHPGCVEIRPRLSELKRIFNRNPNAEIAGVKAIRVTKATTR